MINNDLQHILSIAERIARDAGAILREAAGKPRAIEFKGAIDMVTQYDRQSEALIVAALRSAFPDHLIIGEEGTGEGSATTGRFCWYIDPIDGTTNFAHDLPHYCVSLGLADPDGVPLLGVIYDPPRDECFAGYRGGGASLNGRPLRVSTVDRLDRAVLLSEFSYDKFTNPDNNDAEWTALMNHTQASLSYGAAALDLAYVAAGRADGTWMQGTKAWDVVAGIALVLEAGGRVSNYAGTLDGITNGERIVASNGPLHESILAVLGEARAKANLK